MEGDQKTANSKHTKKVYRNNNFKQKNVPKYDNSVTSSIQNINLNGPPTKFNQQQQSYGCVTDITSSNKSMAANNFQNSSVAPQPGLNNRSTADPSPPLVGDQASLENLLKCTICSTVRKPPIFCCVGGHNVCSVCRTTKVQCTVCRKGLTDVRNMCAEALAMNYRFRCSYGPQGCNELLSFDSEGKHTGECEFRPVGCEVYPCRETRIDRQDYIEHQRKIHHAMNAEIVPNSGNGRMTWRRDIGVKNIENLARQGMRPPTIMEFAGYTFFLWTQSAGLKIWYWVSLFGSPDDAKRFRSTITIKKGEGNNKIASSWTGPVFSVRHFGDEIYLSGLCMVTTEECLKALMFKKNGKSTYSIQVEIDCVA